MSALEGRAGKTTTVGAIRKLAEERGYFVRGFGPTSGSLKALNEAGVLARTVASLLENPKPEKQGKELWIVDESSLLATRQVNRLLHLAGEMGVERIVFVGDERQHHAIEAGRPLFQMRQAGMTVASLTAFAASAIQLYAKLLSLLLLLERLPRASPRFPSSRASARYLGPPTATEQSPRTIWLRIGPDKRHWL